MAPDDDDFDFDDELSDEEMAEARRDMEEEEQRVRKHPLMRQAREISHILDVLLDTSSDEALANTFGSGLRNSAMIIEVKLSATLSSDFYLICMQNAAIIREHAEYLRLSNHSLKMSKGFDEKYVRLFREEMEKFRELFKAWASEIRQLNNEFDDEWGLFVK